MRSYETEPQAGGQMIGQEVRRRRDELGLTGAELAARSGLSPGAISQIENGKRTPSSTTVMKLAQGLGVEVGELYPKGPKQLSFLSDEEIPTFRPEDLSDVERAEYERAKSGEKPRAYFVPLEEGEEEEVVTFRVYYVRLFKGDEPILQAMREASPEEAAAIREQLEKAG
jgi:transcriptional regulator with XRE-family HTH domain